MSYLDLIRPPKMTYLNLLRSAEYKLDKGHITLRRYEEMIEPLKREIQPERKQGEWIPVTNGRGGYECCECRCYAPSHPDGVEWLSDFCPSCGADMRGGNIE